MYSKKKSNPWWLLAEVVGAAMFLIGFGIAVWISTWPLPPGTIPEGASAMQARWAMNWAYWPQQLGIIAFALPGIILSIFGHVLKKG